MQAVLKSGVAVLFGATAAAASGPSSLRGSTSEDPVVTAEEGATLDALSDIFFALPEGSGDLIGVPSENSSAPSLDLSANVATETAKCSGGWSGMVEKIAPGCLGQCQRYGICGDIQRVVNVWSRFHSKEKAKQEACKNKYAFDCLLRSDHKKKCQPLIVRAPKFGIPTSVNQACPRRLQETTAQEVNAGLPSEPALERMTEEAAEDEAPALGHANWTLDAMVAATLSSDSQGCHCSTGELRQCGARCFGQHSGWARVKCIRDCLIPLHHSKQCSECYGQRSDCTMNKCLSKCASGPNSPACTSCVHSKCGGDCR